MITIRSDSPVNLVGAFEKPVLVEADGGYAKKSIAALEAKEAEVYERWYKAPEHKFVVGKDCDLDKVISDVCEAIKA
jgi:hypothetical protein